MSPSSCPLEWFTGLGGKCFTNYDWSVMKDTAQKQSNGSGAQGEAWKKGRGAHHLPFTLICSPARELAQPYGLGVQGGFPRRAQLMESLAGGD